MSEFSIDFLATVAGISAFTVVVTEATKRIVRDLFPGGCWLTDGRIQAGAFLVAIIGAFILLPIHDVRSGLVAFANGLVAALNAMKGYELVAPMVKSLWSGDEGTTE